MLFWVLPVGCYWADRFSFHLSEQQNGRAEMHSSSTPQSMFISPLSFCPCTHACTQIQNTYCLRAAGCCFYLEADCFKQKSWLSVKLVPLFFKDISSRISPALMELQSNKISCCWALFFGLRPRGLKRIKLIGCSLVSELVLVKKYKIYWSLKKRNS